MTPANAWLAVSGIALILATLYAFAVVVFRLPAFSGDNRSLFRTALVLHVELAVFVWLVTTMAAQWQAPANRRSAWLPPAIAGAGTILLAVSPLADGNPLMLDYFPLLAGNPVFSLGFSLICLGVLFAAFETLRSSQASEACRLSAWASLMALLAAVMTIRQDSASVGDIAWAAGHTLLFAHVIMLTDEWSRLSGLKLSSTGIRWLAVSVTLLPWVPILAAPGDPWFQRLYSLSMIVLLWPPALWAMSRLIGAPAFRPQAFDRLTLALSMSFFVVGCGLGALIDAPTTLVTAHYHATMGAIAISRMAISYRGFAPALDTPEVHKSMQLTTYACGLALLATGLALASIEGAPRKTPASELIHHGPLFVLGMSISGLGGLLAMLGTGWWIHNLFLRPWLRPFTRKTRPAMISGPCDES